MLKKRNIQYLILILITLLLCSTIVFRNNILSMISYSKATLSNNGSHGQEVIDIQSKLYHWGYYNGVVDGDYGYKTYQAVRSFQSKNGLTVDGIAGPETLGAMGLSTVASNKTSDASLSNDANLNLLAHLIYGEARGEPYTGQVAVGAVILNRTNDDRFPRTVAGVIYQPGAFDAVDDGQINLQPDNNAYDAAKDALNGWDPSYGCVYYYNPATATSKWIWGKTIMLKIGNHNFAK